MGFGPFLVGGCRGRRLGGRGRAHRRVRAGLAAGHRRHAGFALTVGRAVAAAAVSPAAPATSFAGFAAFGARCVRQGFAVVRRCDLGASDGFVTRATLGMLRGDRNAAFDTGRCRLVTVPASSTASAVAATTGLTLALRLATLGCLGTGQRVDEAFVGGGRGGFLGRLPFSGRIRSARFPLGARTATAFATALTALTARFAAALATGRALFATTGRVGAFHANPFLACRALGGALGAATAAFTPAAIGPTFASALAATFAASFATTLAPATLRPGTIRSGVGAAIASRFGAAAFASVLATIAATLAAPPVATATAATFTAASALAALGPRLGRVPGGCGDGCHCRGRGRHGCGRRFTAEDFLDPAEEPAACRHGCGCGRR